MSVFRFRKRLGGGKGHSHFGIPWPVNTGPNTFRGPWPKWQPFSFFHSFPLLGGHKYQSRRKVSKFCFTRLTEVKVESIKRSLFAGKRRQFGRLHIKPVWMWNLKKMVNFLVRLDLTEGGTHSLFLPLLFLAVVQVKLECCSFSAVIGSTTKSPYLQYMSFVLAAGVAVLLIFALLFFSVFLYVAGRRETKGVKWYQCFRSGDTHFAR